MFLYLLTAWSILNVCNSHDSKSPARPTKVRETARHLDPLEIVNRTVHSKTDLPQWQNDLPVHVNMHIYVESISGVSTTDMAFEVDVYMHMSWEDTRYRHNHSEPYLISEPEHYKHLWRPNVFFANAMESRFHHVTVPNTYYRIYSNGEVFYSTRVSLKASCHQNLRSYPLDKQHCFIRMGSYSYPLQKMVLIWDNATGGMDVNPNVELAEMRLVHHYASYCNGTYIYAQTKSYYMNSHFSCLTANFNLSRQMGYHVAHTYIPTILIVCISWVSFFIDPAAIPARISLSFTTLLTLSTLAIGVRNSLPPLDYIKSIDVWMGACMTFLFMALVQFAAVNSFMRRATGMDTKLQPPALIARKKSSLRKIPMLKDAEIRMTLQGEAAVTKIIEEGMFEERQRLVGVATKIDQLSQILFPATFMIFNLVYWIVYTRSE